MKKNDGKRKIMNFCRNTYLLNNAVNKRLAKTERKYNLKKGILLKAKRAAIIAAAATIPASIGTKTATNEYVFYTAKDSVADEHSGEVPLITKDKNIIFIPEGNLIVYEENIDFGKKNVQAIDAEGKIVEGEISKEYLEKIGDIKKDEFEQYDTIYKVDIAGYTNDSDEYLNISVPINEETDVTSKEKEKINNGSMVFGLPVYDTSKWIEVIYMNGNKEVRGYMLSQYLKEVGSLEVDTEKQENNGEIIMRVDTSKDNNIDLNLRSEMQIGDNIIIKIPNGKEVKLVTGEIEKGKARDWYEVEYIDEESGKNYVGYVDASYLIEKDVIQMQVSTKGSPLNLRDKPGEDGKVIGKIKNGTIISIIPGDTDNSEWVKVKLDDQTEGYVNSNYLKTVQKKEKNKKTSDAKVSIGEGEILGIDASGIRKNQLREMLKSSNPLGEVNEAYANKKIGYVYIKIGGFGYVNFSTTGLPDETIEQIQTCEEAGIPYGFYFYSTCRTNEEAKKEKQIIEQNLEEVSKSVKNMKYNLLPFAIDVEVGGKTSLTDRQHYSNWKGMEESQEEAIESVSNAKAYLANLLKANTGEEPIVYTGTRATKESDDKIFDIEIYEEGVGYTPKIWYAAPYEDYGEISRTNREGMKNMPEGSIAIVQCTLDAQMGEKKVLVDVDRADSKALKELIGEEHIEKITQIEQDR